MMGTLYSTVDTSMEILFPGKNQQDATLHNLFISVKCSICFRRFLRPSPGAQNCIYSIGFFVKIYCYLPLHGTGSVPSLPVAEMELNQFHAVAGSSKDLTKYSMLYIQFWAPDDGRRNRLKHVQNFTEINKLCSVASYWWFLKICLRCTNPWMSNLNENLTF